MSATPLTHAAELVRPIVPLDGIGERGGAREVIVLAW